MRLENKQYLTYIAKYLGVALIAGSVVHTGTLQNGFTRYVVLAVIGLGLMLLGNIVEALQNNQKINLKYFVSIIGLSFATGFLSGGVQHYLDNPSYASYLLSIGLLVSYITFFLKDKLVLTSKSIIVVTVMSIVLLFSSQIFGSGLIDSLHEDISGPHGH